MGMRSAVGASLVVAVLFWRQWRRVVGSSRHSYLVKSRAQFSQEPSAAQNVAGSIFQRSGHITIVCLRGYDQSPYCVNY